MKDPRKVSDGQFKALAEGAVNVIAQNIDEAKLLGSDELKSMDPIMLKQCFASTVSLAAYFAKTDAEATLIKELLTKQGLPEGRAEVFAAVVSANKRLLRALVGGVGFQFDHIVDVQWRVDYQVKSDSIEKIHAPLFFVTLKTVRPDKSLGEVSFTASLEEMTSLVAKVKDATAAIERVDLMQ